MMQPVDLYFEVYGDPQTCPLIILHGFLASSRNWRSIAKRLAESHHVYVLDMRNHGASPHAETMDYPLMTSDIVAFMDKLELNQAHILGHSMGGKIAMWLALHYPHRVKNLLVADIAPVHYQHCFDNMIQALRQLPLDKIANRKDAELFLSDAIPDTSFRQFLLQNLLLKEGGYYWRINLDILQKTAPHIVTFPKPTTAQLFLDKALFIAGEHSKYIRPESIYALFPQAKIVEIPNTGHWLFVEAPEAFCQTVNSWLINDQHCQ